MPRRDGRLHDRLDRSQRGTVWLRNMRGSDRRLASALRKHFDAIRDAVAPLLIVIEANPSPDAVARIFVPEDWDARLLSAAAGPVGDAVASGAAVEYALSRRVRSLPPGWTYLVRAGELPAAARRAVNRFTTRILSKPYWLDVHRSFREDMAAAVRRSVRAGDPPEKTAAAVLAAMGPAANQRRAGLIARTETTGAVNAGGEAVRGALWADGEVLGKSWVSVADGDTRHDHAAAHGQEVGPRRYFRVGGELCLYPGDTRLSAAQRCNCRCWAETVWRTDPSEAEVDEGEDASGDEELG